MFYLPSFLQLTVIEEAIKYIDELHHALAERLRSDNGTCQKKLQIIINYNMATGSIPAKQACIVQSKLALRVTERLGIIDSLGIKYSYCQSALFFVLKHQIVGIALISKT